MVHLGLAARRTSSDRLCFLKAHTGGASRPLFFRSALAAHSVEALLTPIRPLNGACWPRPSMRSSSWSAVVGSARYGQANTSSVGGSGGSVERLPVPGQELGDGAGRMVGNAR